MFETSSIVAANPTIHKALLGVVADARKTPLMMPQGAEAATRLLQKGMMLPVCDASIFG